VVIVEGLFNEPDGTVIAYKDIDYLYEAADVIVMKNEDDEFLLIDEDSFEWLEGWGNNPQDGSIKWIADLTIYRVTRCRVYITRVNTHKGSGHATHGTVRVGRALDKQHRRLGRDTHTAPKKGGARIMTPISAG
jgi:hypothetical protein